MPLFWQRSYLNLLSSFRGTLYMAFPVAVIQMFIESGDIEQNRQTVTRMVAAAVSGGARLIVFPEACITDINRSSAGLAEPIPGPTTDLVARIAGGAVIALPLLQKDENNRIYSACALISKDRVLGVARKTHLYRDESGHDTFRDSELMAAGNELGMFELGEARVGVLLGFDAEFPEAFRALSLRGADLILVVLNRVEPDHGFLSAMALRNRVPLLVSNRMGFKKIYPAVPEFSASSIALLQDKEGSFLVRCKGSSAIIDADGRTVAQPCQEPLSNPDAPAGMAIPLAHFQEEKVLTASFRIEELRVRRMTSPYIAERRVDLY